MNAFQKNLYFLLIESYHDTLIFFNAEINIFICNYIKRYYFLLFSEASAKKEAYLSQFFSAP